eukprot:3915368-Rhodomonas_salina.3
MKHIESVKLSVAAEHERWWIGAAVHCIGALLNGVQGLHNCRIIHSDIKPSNVLILPSLTDVKICNLGNASNDTVGADKAKAMEAWAVGVTALCFSCGCCYGRLVDVKHGQDYELCCRACNADAAGEVAVANVWTLTLAKQCSKRTLNNQA